MFFVFIFIIFVIRNTIRFHITNATQTTIITIVAYPRCHIKILSLLTELRLTLIVNQLVLFFDTLQTVHGSKTITF